MVWLILGLAGTAMAIPVTVDITATVDTVHSALGSAAGVIAGDELRVQFTYDPTECKPQDDLDGWRLSCSLPSVMLWGDVSIGSYVPSIIPEIVNVDHLQHDVPGGRDVDYVGARASWQDAQGEEKVGLLVSVFQYVYDSDDQHDNLSSPLWWDLSAPFEVGLNYYHQSMANPLTLDDYDSYLSLNAVVTKVSGLPGLADPVPDPVPEPGTVLLLSAGLLGLVAFRRKYTR